MILDLLGGDMPVENLNSDDFEMLRSKPARGVGLVTLGIEQFKAPHADPRATGNLNNGARSWRRSRSLSDLSWNEIADNVDHIVRVCPFKSVKETRSKWADSGKSIRRNEDGNRHQSSTSSADVQHEV